MKLSLLKVYSFYGNVIYRFSDAETVGVHLLIRKTFKFKEEVSDLRVLFLCHTGPFCVTHETSVL